MLSELDLWQTIIASVGWQMGVLDDLYRHRIIRRLIGYEVTDYVKTTDAKLKASGVKTVAELQKLPYDVGGHSDEVQRQNRQLKDFLFANMYNSYRVVRMQVKAARIIQNLFNAYTSEPTILPKHIQGWTEDRSLQRAVCDYIAGMTDRFAIEEHQKLFDPSVLP
jgi:dGTPase